MKFSKETIRFADSLIHHYAKFDEIINGFDFSLDDVPDSDLDELSFYLMQSNKELAHEALSSENVSFESVILRDLLPLMRNSQDKEKEIQFVNATKFGIRKYLMPIMDNLLQERLENYNCDEGFVREIPSVKSNSLWGI